MKYEEFLQRKKVIDQPDGPGPVDEILPALFDFQRDIVRWALRRGRAAIWADCGLGKTPMQLEWARQMYLATGRPVMIVAPLAVSSQTIREGAKFGIPVDHWRDGEITDGIGTTNYERLHRFDPADFGAIVLDESSILKSYTGKYRTDLVQRWSRVPYRLACTATPAPNDFMEIGNHAEFLGTMSRTEMLSMFFVHDGGETQKWRLKGHAESEYWKWMCSWATMLRKPSDLGYEDGGFKLPPLNVEQVEVEIGNPQDGFLFHMEAKTLEDRRAARRDTIAERVAATADIINQSNEQWLVWCGFNDESTALTRAINGAVEVKGADSDEHKERSAVAFQDGSIRVLVTKPTMFGFGMNFQCCHNMAFVGLSDSYEQYYQALRRCWRFGQSNPVNAYIVISARDGAVLENIGRKESQAESMANNMVSHMAKVSREIIHDERMSRVEYVTQSKMEVPSWLTLA